MKKLSFISMALFVATLVFSCSKVGEADNAPREARKVSIAATTEIPTPYGETKASITDAGAFSWTAGDAIKIYNGSGFSESSSLTADGTSANFQVTLVGNQSLQKVAVFPATAVPVLDGNKLTLTLPSEIAWEEGKAQNVMIATADFSTKSLNFKNVGAIFKVTLKNVPAGAAKVEFDFGKRISGTFEIEDITADGDLQIEAVAGSGTVTFTFDELAANKEEMVFYVPVPVGTYEKFGFDVKGTDDSSLWNFSVAATNTVARKKLLIFPDITNGSIGGGIETATAYLSTPENFVGTVKLPKTADAVNLDVNPTASAIVVQYADGATAGEKPSTVNIQVLSGEVNKLDINLPNSTVFVNGVSSASIVSLDAVTSSSTLHVEENITIETATIKQGNANIEGAITDLIVATGATADGESAKVVVVIKENGSVGNINANAPINLGIDSSNEEF